MLAGRYPSDEFAELRPRLVWDRVDRHAHRPARGAAARRHQRRHDPRPRAVRRLPRRRRRARRARGSASSTRRWSTSRGSATCSRSARRPGGSRTSPTTGCWSRPAPGSAGAAAVLEGRRARPAGRARPGARRVRPRAGRPDAGRGATRAVAGGRARRVGRRQPAGLPRRAAGGHRPRARRPHDRGRAVPRRARRLAGRRALAVRRPGARAVGAGHRGAAARAVRRRRAGDARRRRHRAAAARHRARRRRRPPQAEHRWCFDPDEVEQLVTAEVGGSALFAARFRECAARALLLPRRDPGRRTPLWQQRQRAAQLLAVACDYGSFPIVLETMRECLQDVFDVPGLVGLMRDVEARQRARSSRSRRQQPSPFARSLLFGYVARSSTRATRRWPSGGRPRSSLDPTLLAELLGRRARRLRELLDPDAVAELERASCSGWPTTAGRATLEGVADLLRVLGPLTTAEAVERGATPAWLAELEEARRAIRVRVAGEERWVAVEDAGRLRDALGVPLPVGVPEAFLEPVRDPLGDLVARYARTHGPFTAGRRRRAARPRAGASSTQALRAARAERAGWSRASSGPAAPAPSGATPRCCARCGAARWPRCARRSSRSPAAALAAFLPAWQQRRRPAARRRRRAAGRRAAAGRAVPASALESLVLPARVAGLLPRAARRAVRGRRGALGRARRAARRRRLGRAAPGRRRADLTAARRPTPRRSPPRCTRPLLDALDGGGALFFRQLSDAARRRHRRAGDDRRWSRRCGTSSGPATSPTTRWRRCARWSAAVGGAHRPAGGRRRAVATAAAGRRMPSPHRARRARPAAGRLLPERETDPTRRAARAGRGAARPARRGHPRRGRAPSARRAASPRSTGCSRRSRRPGGAAAATSSRGSAPPSSRVPGAVDRLRAVGASLERAGEDPRAGAGDSPRRPGARRHRPGQPVRRRPAAGRRRGEDASGRAPARAARRARSSCSSTASSALYVERGGRTLLSFTDDAGPAAARGRRPGARRARRAARAPHRRAGRRQRGARLAARPGAGGGRLPRDAAGSAPAGLSAVRDRWWPRPPRSRHGIGRSNHRTSTQRPSLRPTSR